MAYDPVRDEFIVAGDQRIFYTPDSLELMHGLKKYQEMARSSGTNQTRPFISVMASRNILQPA
jgi:hypothetical protein